MHCSPRRLVAMSLFLLSSSASAAGPSDVAKADASLWPLAIESRADFDAASRAELLVSALVLDGYGATELQPSDLGIKGIHAQSLSDWRAQARIRWLALFGQASQTCTPKGLACGFIKGSWSDFVAFARQNESAWAASPAYSPWLENARTFHRTYVKEQLRLAALFPHPTSEILPLSGDEVLGDELGDGQFIISFDDGPTPIGGNTDIYSSMLREQGVSGFFFVLGNAMEQRLKTQSAEAIKAIYDGQCLGSHGLEHKPHPKWSDWQVSLDKTTALVRRVSPAQTAVMFRPPYGQRQHELVEHLAASDAKVILWNIDSQDWHSKMSPEDVAARVTKLMLVKRHGILLFHDTHAKALAAVPEIAAFAHRAGLSWADCHRVH